MKKEIEVNENMLEGRNAVTEALKAGRTIDKVFLASGDTDSTPALYRHPWQEERRGGDLL